MSRIFRILLVAVMVCGTTVSVAAKNEIGRILALPTAPAGVVFEIASGQESGLAWALPEIKHQSARLRARFPGLSITVVSHGKEQFALSQDNKQRFRAVHDAVRQIRQDDIEVQVCGTHAGWRNLDREDFPDYVGVVAAAPVTIDNYRQIGYEVVFLRKPAAR